MTVGVALTKYPEYSGDTRTYTQLLDHYVTDIGSAPALVRTYESGGPGDLMGHWQYSDAHDYGIGVIHHSFKGSPQDVLAGAHDSGIDTLLASVPSGQQTRLTYYHEPENNVEDGDFTAQQFVDAALYVYDKVAAAANPDITYGPVLMSYTLRSSSGRNIGNYRTGTDGRDLFALADFVGWDAYNDASWQGGWWTPKETYGVIKTFHANNPGIGPPLIAETGTVPDLADLTRRGQWIKDAAAYCAAFGCLTFDYFDSDVGGHPFFLRVYEDSSGTFQPDPDTIAAWQTVVSSYGGS